MKAKKKPATKAPAKKAAPKALLCVKGFDQNLVCTPAGGKPFQYEIGATYTHDGDVVCCGRNGGFHSVEMPLDAWTYYGPAKSRYATVEVSGALDRKLEGDTKVASAQITTKAELKLPDLIRSAVAWIVKAAKSKVASKKKECAAATGYCGHAAATGDSGHAAATGNYGHAAATGDSGHAAATGDSGHAAATGYSGHAAATGNYGHAAATGDSGHAAATGNYGHAAATGDSGHAAATGYSGHAAATGDCGCAFAGFNGRAKCGANGSFAIAWYDEANKRARIIVGVAGENGIKADTFYRVAEGKLVEVMP